MKLKTKDLLTLAELSPKEFSGLIDALQNYNLKEGYILTEDTEKEETLAIDNKRYKIFIKPVI